MHYQWIAYLGVLLMMAIREYAERQLLAEDIKAKVTIEEFSVYHEREVFPEDVYYWRQEYYVRPKARAPSPPPLSLRKRTKEDREKSDHARNVGLVEKHTKMVEKLVDRRRRTEARRLAEDQKRQLEEEQRRSKALTRDATRTTIEIDEDSDHDNEVNEPTEKQAEEIAPFEPVATVVDDDVVEQKKEGEEERETITETATKAEVMETVEGQNGAVETASPPASYAGTASASNRLPSPTPSPHEILQTPPAAISPARKRLRRAGGATLSSLSALSASGSSSTSTSGASAASSLSSLAAARREAQQVSLVPLSQRGRGKHEAIEVNSDDDETASILAQPLPPVVPSVSSSQPQLARRPATKPGAEYEPAVAQERGSRWKMYTQESPDDALQNQYVALVHTAYIRSGADIAFWRVGRPSASRPTQSHGRRGPTSSRCVAARGG